MPLSSQIAMNDVIQAEVIPVWTRSLGSWRFSIGRRPFAVSELEGHYDKASGSWHTTITQLGFETAYIGLMDQALAELIKVDRTSPLKVLDAGIGTAYDLTGVDVSSEMLRQAEKRLHDGNLTAQLLQGDVNDLPFDNDTFDVILVAHVIEHMAAPERALAELYRVLKPGGVLIACVTQRSSAGVYIQFKWRTHRVDEQTAITWFQQCGLSKVRTIPLEHSAKAKQFSKGYVGCKPKSNH